MLCYVLTLFVPIVFQDNPARLVTALRHLPMQGSILDYFFTSKEESSFSTE